MTRMRQNPFVPVSPVLRNATSWASWGCAGLLSAALAVGGCDKRDASQQSGGAAPGQGAIPSGIPALEGPHSEKGGQPEAKDKAKGRTEGGAELKLPPGHPPIGAMAGEQGKGDKPVNPFEGQMPAIPPGGPAVEGEIVLSPNLKPKAKAGAVLFLSVRQDEGGTPGQVLAVDRFETKGLPVRFSVDASKAMVPGTSFKGNVLVMARIDQDGDAMTKSPGDLQGMAKAQIPAKGVRVTIDTVLP